MQRYNLHDKFVIALKALGATVHNGRTRKYTEMRLPAHLNRGDALIAYLGKSGAFRTGRTVGRSFPLDPTTKAKLLAAANKLIADEAAGGDPVDVAAAKLAALRAERIAARAKKEQAA